MAIEYTKPTGIEKIWCTTGSKSPAPDDIKTAKGHEVEIPLKETFNYLQNKQDSMLAHLNQHGLPVWDSDSQYLAEKSYIQGSNGVIYVANLDNTNVNPVTEIGAVNWRIAFPPSANVYTKSESDSLFTKKGSNLSDLTSFSAARTNLQVYSKSETDNNYLARTSNLADLTSSPTARNNLNVYSRPEADGRYLALSSNLADTPNKLQAFDTIKQSSTASYAGVTRYANDAESGDATSTSTAVTPSAFNLGLYTNFNQIGHIIFPKWLKGFGIMWGTQVVAANSKAAATQSWNVGQILSVVCSPDFDGNTFIDSPHAYSSGAQVWLWNTYDFQISIKWQAIVRWP